MRHVGERAAPNRHTTYPLWKERMMEPKPVYSVAFAGSGGAAIVIHTMAMGGNAVGECVNGAWRYAVECDGELIVTGDDIVSNGDSETHMSAAVQVAAYLAHQADTNQVGNVETDYVRWSFGVFAEAVNDFVYDHASKLNEFVGARV